MKEVLAKKADGALLVGDTPSVTARWYQPGVLEIEWRGHVTGETITEALTKAKGIQGGARVHKLIANTTHVHGYALSVRTPSMRFMEYFREQGVKEFIGIIPNNAVRMFASSMALVIRIKFPLFSTHDKAVEYLLQSVNTGTGRD